MSITREASKRFADDQRQVSQTVFEKEKKPEERTFEQKILDERKSEEIKSEENKIRQKKSDEQKPEEKKVEEEKPEEKSSEAEKRDEKKPEEQKPDEENPEVKKVAEEKLEKKTDEENLEEKTGEEKPDEEKSEVKDQSEENKKSDAKSKEEEIAAQEEATLDSQFFTFAKLFESGRDGLTITLYRSDYWMRQAKIIDDRKVTMTETGILFNKYAKTEITYDEWLDFLSDLCDYRELDEEYIKELLTKCGIPGQIPVHVPQYRDFFDTYRPRDKMIYVED